MNPAFEVYEDAAGEWRWRLVAGNGLTVADGAEGYDSQHNVTRAVETVRVLVTESEVRW